MNAEAPIVGAGLVGERDPRPVVALPRSGLPGLAIAAICLVMAVLLFLLLNGRREAAQADGLRRQSAPATAFAVPPPLVLPAEQQQEAPLPPPLRIVTNAPEPLRLRVSPQPAARSAPQRRYVPPAAPAYTGDPEPFYQPPQTFDEPAPQPAPTFEEPALVLDSGGAARGGAAAGAAGERPQATQTPTPAAQDKASPRVTRLADPAAVMPVGTLIQAVLETPIDTFKPGLARAVVSRDARGFNGQQVLVPRGSRLTGEYQADARSGQNRVLITWTQLIRPDGSVIRLDSPSADELGTAGVAGRADGSGFGRFASGVLRTALAVGTSWASWSGRVPVVVGMPATQLPAAVGQSAGAGRRNQRIRVKQGTAFNVFVARNLDFSDVPASR